MNWKLPCTDVTGAFVFDPNDARRGFSTVVERFTAMKDNKPFNATYRLEFDPRTMKSVAPADMPNDIGSLRP